jgi:hypothetical protein
MVTDKPLNLKPDAPKPLNLKANAPLNAPIPKTTPWRVLIVEGVIKSVGNFVEYRYLN